LAVDFNLTFADGTSSTFNFFPILWMLLI